MFIDGSTNDLGFAIVVFVDHPKQFLALVLYTYNMDFTYIFEFT